MKHLYAILTLFVITVSCKSEKSETPSEVEKELTIAEKLQQHTDLKTGKMLLKYNLLLL